MKNIKMIWGLGTRSQQLLYFCIYKWSAKNYVKFAKKTIWNGFNRAFSFYFLFSIYLKELERKGDRDLPSIGSLPQWLQQLRLGQAETRSEELHCIFHMGVGFKYLGPLLLLLHYLYETPASHVQLNTPCHRCSPLLLESQTPHPQRESGDGKMIFKEVF